MSKRDYFDFSDFISQPLEAFSEAIRRSFGYDRYAGKNVFPAVVLTPPVPMMASEAGLFTGASRPTIPSGDEDQYAGPDAALNKVDKFFFRARILGIDSPHSFLPDPCLLAMDDTTPPDTYFKLCAMHTLFVSSEDYQLQHGAQIPTRGYVVLVELERNQFGFNLDTGRFLNVLSKTNPYYNVESLSSENCVGMDPDFDFSEALGNSLLGSPLEVVYNGPFGTNVKFKNGAPPPSLVAKIDTRYSTNAKSLLKGADADWNRLAKAYFEQTGKKLPTSSGLRTFKGQVQAKKDWCAKGNCGNAAKPGTSNHGYGTAMDVSGVKKFSNPLYKWLDANGPKYNWHNPPQHREDGSKPEAWHWEWTLKDTVLSSPTVT